ncbi:MAG: polysaccharide deacetylase [Labilithrix sp.]|nr:polysaccharide deacetylase [Labilithrix sp.]
MNLRTVKRAVKRTLSSLPGWRVLGPIVRAPGVIVLTYHRILGKERRLPGISIEAFSAQMRWVRHHCDPIEPDSLMEHARRPRSMRPSVLVTFDDGYRDYHDLAYPVLKELGIPAVVFLATSFVDQGGMLWTDHVEWAARSTPKERVKLPWSDHPEIVLTDARSRVALSDRVRAHLKTLPNAQRRSALAALMNDLEAPEYPDRQMLTWDEVRSTMDLTRYGGHTHTHPILSRLQRDEAALEIRTCRDRIASETGKTPTLFAYPNGGPADYTNETKGILRDHGFTTAFSTTEGIAGASSDWMAVPRLPSGDVDMPDFVWMAAGLMRS